jgi:hypothetical protein
MHHVPAGYQKIVATASFVAMVPPRSCHARGLFMLDSGMRRRLDAESVKFMKATSGSCRSFAAADTARRGAPRQVDLSVPSCPTGSRTVSPIVIRNAVLRQIARCEGELGTAPGRMEAAPNFVPRRPQACTDARVCAGRPRDSLPPPRWTPTTSEGLLRVQASVVPLRRNECRTHLPHR